jgi:hypothetical protein
MSIQNIVKTTVARIEYPVYFSADMVAYLHGYVGRYDKNGKEGCLIGPRFKMNKLTLGTARAYGFNGTAPTYSLKVKDKPTRYIRDWNTIYVDGQKFTAGGLWKFLNENG